MARAQWIGLGLAAALAVALTAGLVFVILTIVRPGDQPAAQPAPRRPRPRRPPVRRWPTSSDAGRRRRQLGPTPTPPAQFGPTRSRSATPRAKAPTCAASRARAARRSRPSRMARWSRSSGRIETPRAASGGTCVILRATPAGSWQASWSPEGTSRPQRGRRPGLVAHAGDNRIDAQLLPQPRRRFRARPAAGQVAGADRQHQRQLARTSAPSRAGAVLKTLPEGAAIEVLARGAHGRRTRWRRVRDSAGVTGWMVAGAVVPPGSVPTRCPGCDERGARRACQRRCSATPRPAQSNPTAGPGPTATSNPNLAGDHPAGDASAEAEWVADAAPLTGAQPPVRSRSGAGGDGWAADDPGGHSRGSTNHRRRTQSSSRLAVHDQRRLPGHLRQQGLRDQHVLKLERVLDPGHPRGPVVLAALALPRRPRGRSP